MSLSARIALTVKEKNEVKHHTQCFCSMLWSVPPLQWQGSLFTFCHHSQLYSIASSQENLNNIKNNRKADFSTTNWQNYRSAFTQSQSTVFYRTRHVQRKRLLCGLERTFSNFNSLHSISWFKKFVRFHFVGTPYLKILMCL